MAVVRPFKAVRPTPELSAKVAALPYDVMNSDEAREMVKGNPYSFLHIDKAEIDLDPSIDHYDQRVYEKAADTFNKMIKDGTFIQDEKPCYYVYRQIMDGRAQTGIVGCAPIDDYMNNNIKKHELTRADKETDRVNHVDFLDADTKYLYIADGHHRSASAVRVGRKRRAQNPDFTGNEEFNFFLSVLFPDEQLYIMDYNRVVTDLNGLTETEFFAAVENKFDVAPFDGEGQYRPDAKHKFGMFISGKWYILTAKAGTFDESDPVERLDVSILQKNLLSPILGIGDPRTDNRIDFVGGIRGLKELERRVENGMKVAFSMFPTTIEDLIDIADAGQIMPPKSTWFEPKLMSGLFIHKLK